MSIRKAHKNKKPPLVIFASEGFAFLKSGIYSFKLGTVHRYIYIFNVPQIKHKSILLY